MGSSVSLSLFLDTTLSGVSLALGDASGAAEAFIFSIHPQKEAATKNINKLMHELFQEGSKKFPNSDLKNLFVSVGPGSFTGIKVGLAWAYGFWSTQRETLHLQGLSSFTALAHSLTGELFLPSTQTHGYRCSSSGSPELFNTGDSRGGTPIEQEIAIIGNWPLLEQALHTNSQSFRSLSPEESSLRAIKAMIQKSQYQKSEPTVLPEAFYLRRSSAEEKADEKRRGT